MTLRVCYGKQGPRFLVTFNSLLHKRWKRLDCLFTFIDGESASVVRAVEREGSDRSDR